MDGHGRDGLFPCADLLSVIDRALQGEVMPQDFAQEEWFERFLSEHHSLAFQSENSKYSVVSMCRC